MKRNYNKEAKDLKDRKYHYDFDGVLRHYMMQDFAPFLPKGKALELGCYMGEFTEIISGKYKDLTVIEASDENITAADKRTKGKVKFINSTFEEVKLKEKFDAIFLIHTLEHLDNPVEVLARAKTWLSPKGRLFLAVPNANAASRQIAVKMGLISHNSAVTEGERIHGHRITYEFKTLERDVKKAKLKIKKRGGVFFKPFANFQFDKLMKTDIIDKAYLDGCHKLGKEYPDLSASIYFICSK